MIKPFDEQGGVINWNNWVGMNVFYQQPHMKWPEYGQITSIQQLPHYIHVRFGFDTNSKACRPDDLHWPPNYCAQYAPDNTNQNYSDPAEIGR